jgi:hypothetical protein
MTLLGAIGYLAVRKEGNMKTPTISTRMTAVLLEMLFGGLAHSQSQSKPCPKVIPKTSQEILMIEQSSNKKGCWTRDRNGQLVFIAERPDQYKANPNPATRALPDLPSIGSGSLTGRWDVKVTSVLLANRPFYGTITVEPLLHKMSWICEKETSFRMDTLGAGPMVRCDNPRTMIDGLPYQASPALAPPAVGSGPYTFSYSGSMYKIAGEFVVQGDVILGRVVSRYSDDGSVADSVSVSGKRINP